MKYTRTEIKRLLEAQGFLLLDFNTKMFKIIPIRSLNFRLPDNVMKEIIQQGKGDAFAGIIVYRDAKRPFSLEDLSFCGNWKDWITYAIGFDKDMIFDTLCVNWNLVNRLSQ